VQRLPPHERCWTPENTEITYYPSPIYRKPPVWCTHIILEAGWPPSLVELLHEVYEALGRGQHRLATMGIRAFFEQMMISMVGDHGKFDANLNAFCERGYISLVQRDAMKAILEAGHAVTHRLYNPTERDLKTALDIAENIFEAIYLHPEEAAQVADRVPPRKRKPGKVREPPAL
jgi:Domain of unknown function (DUF4145)